MGRGFLAGIFWGGLIGLFLLVVSNQVMDRRELSFPQPDAAPVEVPGGTEFDQARPETEPVVPEADTRPGSEAIAGVQAPGETSETPPTFDTSALEVPSPSLESPNTLGDAPEVTPEPSLNNAGEGDQAVADDAPSLASPDAPNAAPQTTTEAPSSSEAPSGADTTGVAASEAETSPEADTAAAAVEEPNAGDAPVIDSEGAMASESQSPTVAPEAAPAPDVAEASSGVALPEAGSDDTSVARLGDTSSLFTRPVELQTDRAPSTQAPGLPRLSLDGGDAEAAEGVETATVEPEQTPEPEPEPQPQPQTTAEASQTERTLPTVRRFGQLDEPETEAAPEPETVTEDSTEAAFEPTGRAIVDWRMEFENPGDRPLLSIVLIHDGSSSVADTIRATPETVAIGIDAGSSDAQNVAMAYREAGREVVLIPSLPAGASPQDVEVTLQSNLNTISQAVAVMDSSGEAFQADREAVAQVVDAISATGHGLITFPRGLNTALQQAERNNVPAGLVFRDIDNDAQDSDQIQRALDRAAFRARQDEAVILVGRTSGDTLVALTEWALGTRAQSITIAPISEALDGN